MLSLTFISKKSIDINATIPEQWRSYVTQRYVLDIQTSKAVWSVSIKVQPEDSSYRYRALMQKPQLVLKFSLPFYFEFPVGTSCVFQNQMFTLIQAQDLTKNGTRKIEYNMTMYTDEAFLSVWKLRNIVDAVKQGANAPKDNRLKFSYCAKPHEFIDLIVRNLNKKSTSVKWQRGECIEAPEKTIEFNHAYLDAALSDVASTFETEYEVEYIGMTLAKIHLRRVEHFKDAPVALSYGCGNGFIPGVGRTSETDGAPVKRMFVQGSDRNIDRSTYGSPELLLPKSQTIRYDGTHFEGEDGFNASIARTYASDEAGEYVERTDKISDATKEDSLDCSEIYPSRVGVCTSVVEVNKDKNFFDIIDTTIPEALDFSKCLIAGETMTIVFQSGMLSGKEFDVKYNHAERRFAIAPQEIDGIMMPGGVFVPKAGATPEAGDKYAVFGVQLPDAYICDNNTKTGGSWDMMRAAVRSLYECEDQRFTFKGSLQALWAKRHWLEVGGKLVVGGHVLFTDPQFVPDGAVIRITGIKDFLTAPYSPTIELSNGVSVGGTSVSSQLRLITNTEVVIEDTERRMMQFTKRRFRDAQETISMLEDAQLENFTGAISPVAVQAMAMLIGDESLQFRFVTKSTDEDDNDHYSESNAVIYYSNQKKQLICSTSLGGVDVYLQHMTLEQNAITTTSRRETTNYRTWPMRSYTSPVLAEASKKYYLYAEVPRNENTTGEFFLSENAVGLHDRAGKYVLLVGVLNSEFDGERSFASLYGFTEILPGRITTDVIVSSDGKTYFNLAKGEIGGNIVFLSEDGTTKTLIDGGKIRTELIDVSQLIAHSVIVGDENGKHVRIEPDSTTGAGSVRIFDENLNECTVLEGTTYGGINELYDGSEGGNFEMLNRTAQSYGYASGVTLGRGSFNVNAGTSGMNESRTVVVSKVFNTKTPTEIRLNTGHLYANAYATGYTYTTNNNGLTMQPMDISTADATINIAVETYKSYDENTGKLSTLISEQYIATANVSANATAQMSSSGVGNWQDNISGDTSTGIGGSSNKTVTVSPDSPPAKILNIANKKVRVPAGYHRIIIRIYTSAYKIGSHAEVAWGATANSRDDVSGRYICDFYVSRYFANGFCLGTRSDNYILAYKTANGMRLKMENNDIGFDFSNAGVRTRVKGNVWMPLPMLIYKATYYFLSTDNGYYIDNSTDAGLSFDGNYMTASRTGKGQVRLTIPEAWKSKLGTLNMKNLIVYVNGLHSVIDARVAAVGSYAIDISMSDDASLNDGRFCITIYYLPSDSA